MEFLDRDVNNMPSISYYEGGQSHECKECRAPIEHKEDYLLDNNDVSELRQVYLLCNCPEGLWLPLAKDVKSFDHSQRVRGAVKFTDLPVATADDLQYVHRHVRNLNPSKYVNKNHVYFTKCHKKEEDFFLQSYIKANIDPEKKLGDELESLANDYYELCCDTIELNLKLGLFNVFLNNTLGHRWGGGSKDGIRKPDQRSDPV